MSRENVLLVKNDTMKAKQFRNEKIVIILTSMLSFAFAIYKQFVWAVVAASIMRPFFADFF